MRSLSMRVIMLALAVLIAGGGATASGRAATSAAASGRAATAGSQPPRAGPTDGDASSYRPPVAGSLHVLRGFSPPATPYGPGHLGVDLADGMGNPVLAAGAGVVRFAGRVAGRGVVVVAHPDGISTEYEPLLVLVRVGARVSAGQPIGRVTGLHRGCPATGCLHWGARCGERYLDPLSLLRPLGVVRLLPWNWAPA